MITSIIKIWNEVLEEAIRRNGICNDCHFNREGFCSFASNCSYLTTDVILVLRDLDELRKEMTEDNFKRR